MPNPSIAITKRPQACQDRNAETGSPMQGSGPTLHISRNPGCDPTAIEVSILGLGLFTRNEAIHFMRAIESNMILDVRHGSCWVWIGPGRPRTGSLTVAEPPIGCPALPLAQRLSGKLLKRSKIHCIRWQVVGWRMARLQNAEASRCIGQHKIASLNGQPVGYCLQPWWARIVPDILYHSRHVVRNRAALSAGKRPKVTV